MATSTAHKLIDTYLYEVNDVFIRYEIFAANSSGTAPVTLISVIQEYDADRMIGEKLKQAELTSQMNKLGLSNGSAAVGGFTPNQLVVGMAKTFCDLHYLTVI